MKGVARAIARRKLLGGSSESALRQLAQNSEKDMKKILKSNNKETLLSLAAALADNPKALSIVQSIIRESTELCPISRHVA
jgi:hypothetical protein